MNEVVEIEICTEHYEAYLVLEVFAGFCYLPVRKIIIWVKDQ
jgi:hypothetical protein